MISEQADNYELSTSTHTVTHIMPTKKVLHGSCRVGQEMKTTPQPTYIYLSYVLLDLYRMSASLDLGRKRTRYTCNLISEKSCDTITVLRTVRQGPCIWFREDMPTELTIGGKGYREHPLDRPLK